SSESLLDVRLARGQDRQSQRGNVNGGGGRRLRTTTPLRPAPPTSSSPASSRAPASETARQALGRLGEAIDGDDRCLLKKALRGILAGVKTGAEPYPTTTGKTRHRVRIAGMILRPGSGQDMLSLLSSSYLASTQ